jgi:aryl-alcohol dehydrogenase-like predicted oxidoreductase
MEEEMRQRDYGTTGVKLSVVGFGGILVRDESAAESSRLVEKAIDAGINYFDVAPSYGNAQEMLGPALKPYRNDVFLACKTGKRTADEAQEELTESLKLLKTDHIDLYQHHAVTTTEDVETILGPGGAMEYFLKARDEGLIRFLGFSAHSEEAAVALLDAFSFDSVLFPLNWVTYNTGKFGPRIIESAGKRGAAMLALKALAKRKWYNEEERKAWPKAWYRPVETYEEAELGLRFTLSQPVTAAVSPGHEQFLDWMVEAEKNFSPLEEEELLEIADRAANLDPIFAV